MPSPTNIALFGINYPPEVTGIAPYTGALAVALGEAGYRVTAHVAHPHYPEWKIQKGYGAWKQTEFLEGIEVHRRRHYVPRLPRGIRRLLSEVSFGLRLALSRLGSPSVVIAVSPSLFSTAIAVLRLSVARSRPRLIVWVQDIYTLGLAETGEGNALVRIISRCVESRTLRAADKVVVIHERFGRFLVEELSVDESKVAVVRNWTHLPPTTAIGRDDARAELGWPQEMTVVVHTGNMGAKQGLGNIVDAARLADELSLPVQFVLIGDGGERSSLEASAFGIKRISFMNPLPDPEYRLALAAADILLVNEKPGVSAMAVPSKLTSYFDAGKPVIAACDPRGLAVSELTAAGAGCFVPPGDASALLNAICTLSTDPKAMVEYGASGRHYRETVLDQNVALGRWLELVNSLRSKP